MIWYLIFMAAGAALIVLGMALGLRFSIACGGESHAEYEERMDDGIKDAMPQRIQRQWENLLNYDGTEQEDDLDAD